MKYYIKVITGFRKEQEHSIPAEEAHKAYYLFNNPDARTTFSNGLALRGDQIKEIVPDYPTTMGWNPDYVLMSDDYKELAQQGVDRELRQLMSNAKDVAQHATPQELNLPLEEIIKSLPAHSK